MKRFKVKYYLSDGIVASEILEGEDAKEVTKHFGNGKQYSCSDEYGIFYIFRLNEVKMIEAEEI